MTQTAAINTLHSDAADPTWSVMFPSPGAADVLTPCSRGARELLRFVCINGVEISRAYSLQSSHAVVLHARAIADSLWYFVSGGHRTRVYVPLCFAIYPGKSDDVEMLRTLERLHLLEFTRDSGRAQYDNLNILLASKAHTHAAVVVACSAQMDKVQAKCPIFTHAIDSRLLMPAFVGHERALQFPVDGPMARHGATLAETLRCWDGDTRDAIVCRHLQLTLGEQRACMRQLAHLFRESRPEWNTVCDRLDVYLEARGMSPEGMSDSSWVQEDHLGSGFIFQAQSLEILRGVEISAWKMSQDDRLKLAESVFGGGWTTSPLSRAVAVAGSRVSIREFVDEMLLDGSLADEEMEMINLPEPLTVIPRPSTAPDFFADRSDTPDSTPSDLVDCEWLGLECPSSRSTHGSRTEETSAANARADARMPASSGPSHVSDGKRFTLRYASTVTGGPPSSFMWSPSPIEETSLRALTTPAIECALGTLAGNCSDEATSSARTPIVPPALVSSHADDVQRVQSDQAFAWDTVAPASRVLEQRAQLGAHGSGAGRAGVTAVELRSPRERIAEIFGEHKANFICNALPELVDVGDLIEQLLDAIANDTIPPELEETVDGGGRQEQEVFCDLIRF